MYIITIDRNSDGALATPEIRLFPEDRTQLEDIGGGRTAVSIEEVVGERATRYESAQSITLIRASRKAPNGALIPISDDLMGNVFNPAVNKVFHSSRLYVVPRGVGSLIRVISPYHEKATRYLSTSTPTVIFATL